MDQVNGGANAGLGGGEGFLSLMKQYPGATLVVSVRVAAKRPFSTHKQIESGNTCKNGLKLKVPMQAN